ncbi:MAG: hypothetical protein H7834_06095 [Magnetococcus sp. YQC-9]
MDRTMVWRMVEYFGMIRQEHPDAHLTQIVLFVGPGAATFPTSSEEPTFRFSYRLVDIREIDCRAILSSDSLEENLLAILCGMENEQETIRALLSRIARLPTKPRADALKKLMILSGLRRLVCQIKEEIDTMAITIDVMENEFLRDIFLRGELEGEHKGRTEGLKEGRKEGIFQGVREGVQRTLTLLLRERFGPLPDWVGQRLAEAELDTLETWLKNSLKSESLTELFH